MLPLPALFYLSLFPISFLEYKATKACPNPTYYFSIWISATKLYSPWGHKLFLSIIIALKFYLINQLSKCFVPGTLLGSLMESWLIIGKFCETDYQINNTANFPLMNLRKTFKKINSLANVKVICTNRLRDILDENTLWLRNYGGKNHHTFLHEELLYCFA